jgi:hypothetical protein
VSGSTQINVSSKRGSTFFLSEKAPNKVFKELNRTPTASMAQGGEGFPQTNLKYGRQKKNEKKQKTKNITPKGSSSRNRKSSLPE